MCAAAHEIRHSAPAPPPYALPPPPPLSMTQALTAAAEGESMAATHAYFSQFNPNPNANFFPYETIGPDGVPIKRKPKRVRRQPIKPAAEVPRRPATPRKSAPRGTRRCAALALGHDFGVAHVWRRPILTHEENSPMKRDPCGRSPP